MKKAHEPYKGLSDVLLFEAKLSDRDYLSTENIVKRHRKWYKKLIRGRISEYNRRYYNAQKSNDFPLSPEKRLLKVKENADKT
jgi:hypothetical protein